MVTEVRSAVIWARAGEELTWGGGAWQNFLGVMEIFCVLIMASAMTADTSTSTQHSLNDCILLCVNYTTVKLLFRNNDKPNYFLSVSNKMKRSHPQKDITGSLEKEYFINNMTLRIQSAGLLITFLPDKGEGD